MRGLTFIPAAAALQAPPSLWGELKAQIPVYSRTAAVLGAVLTLWCATALLWRSRWGRRARAWVWAAWRAYVRDLLGKEQPPPLPRRTRTTALAPPRYPDGRPLDEWEGNRWRRLVHNYSTSESAEPTYRRGR